MSPRNARGRSEIRQASVILMICEVLQTTRNISDGKGTEIFVNDAALRMCWKRPTRSTIHTTDRCEAVRIGSAATLEAWTCNGRTAPQEVIIGPPGRKSVVHRCMRGWKERLVCPTAACARGPNEDETEPTVMTPGARAEGIAVADGVHKDHRRPSKNKKKEVLCLLASGTKNPLSHSCGSNRSMCRFRKICWSIWSRV